MTVDQAAAVVTLWRSRKFSTADIAALLAVAEAAVCRVIHAVAEAEKA